MNIDDNFLTITLMHDCNQFSNKAHDKCHGKVQLGGRGSSFLALSYFPCSSRTSDLRRKIIFELSYHEWSTLG